MHDPVEDEELIPSLSPKEKEQRLEAMRHHYGMTDAQLIALAETKGIYEPDHLEWLILLGRGDLFKTPPRTEEPMTYWQQVRRFNEMYKLPTPELPTDCSNESLDQFKSILAEEVEEVEDIKAIIDPLERLTALSDWLGDIIVYCSTKANMHGLPMPAILDYIMQSNFSKLGADGKPIYDERGKVLKGPNYWKPEPKIKEHLDKLINPPGYLTGRLSNEASQDSEGAPVYLFCDGAKQGYESWVSLRKGQRLVVTDNTGNVVFDAVLKSNRINGYTMPSHTPPLKVEWFDCNYAAVLYLSEPS